MKLQSPGGVVNVMSVKMPDEVMSRHHIKFDELPTRARTAKAEIKKLETVAREDFSVALNDARWALKWPIKKLASELGKDMAQVSRWLDGKEPVQVAAIWSVKALRQPFVTALAKIAGARITPRIEWEQIA